MICCFVNKLNDKMALDVYGESTKPGTGLIIHDFHGNPNQQFEIRENNIICVHSNLVLDVSGELKPGSSVIQAEPNGSDSQKFFLKGDGTIQTINGLCLESSTPRTANRGQVVIQEPNWCDSQKFRCITNL